MSSWYIDQPLDEYLSEQHAGSITVLSERTSKFIQALARALDMARPQINIEKAFHRKVYKEPLNLQVVVSAIPFTDEIARLEANGKSLLQVISLCIFFYIDP